MPTPAGRAERDAFDAWHSERLSQLRTVEERLCFGRLDLDGGHRRYVGDKVARLARTVVGP